MLMLNHLVTSWLSMILQDSTALVLLVLKALQAWLPGLSAPVMKKNGNEYRWGPKEGNY